MGLRSDVFAADEASAQRVARVFYEIPDHVDVTITRVTESGHGHHGSGRTQLATSAAFGLG